MCGHRSSSEKYVCYEQFVHSDVHVALLELCASCLEKVEQEASRICMNTPQRKRFWCSWRVRSS